MVVHSSKCGAQTLHGEQGKELAGCVKSCTHLEMPHYLRWCLIYQTRTCAIGWAQQPVAYAFGKALDSDMEKVV